MPRSLPPNPSLRFLQLEAKNIVKAHRRGELRCCETLRCHPRFSAFSDEDILKADVSLQEAQHALSLDYGYTKWPDLAKQANASRGGRTDRELRKAIDVLQTSKDPYQQLHAISTIGKLRIEEGLPHILPFIESSSKYLQEEAVGSVIRIMGDRSRPLVFHLLDGDASERAKEWIAEHFAHSEKDKKSIDYLMTKFRTAPDDRYRHGIAYRLLGLRTDLAIPFIRKDIRSGNRVMRYRALISLRGVHYPERTDDWQWVLENEHVKQIKLKAIQIVGENRIKEVIPLIERIASSDDRPEIREAAGLALDRIRGR